MGAFFVGPLVDGLPLVAQDDAALVCGALMCTDLCTGVLVCVLIYVLICVLVY